jgi:N-acetylneuraminic acid mutarotase
VWVSSCRGGSPNPRAKRHRLLRVWRDGKSVSRTQAAGSEMKTANWAFAIFALTITGAVVAHSSASGQPNSVDRPRPGSPETGWSGLSSPAEPVSDGPGMGAWTTKAGLPTARSEVGVAEAGGKIYVVGGYADGRADQPLNQEYDPATDLWRRRAPMLRGANHVAPIGFGGKLYAIGGFVQQNFSAISDVSVYDPSTDRWTALAPLPIPLGSMAVAVLDGKIHAVGGASGASRDERKTVNVHFVYDISTNTWSRSTPLPYPREHLNLIAFDGTLYAIGGRIDNYVQNVATVYTCKPSEDQWTELPLMPTARSGTQAAVLKGKIFVFGGEKLGGVFNQTEMFDPITGRWSTLTPMPVGRHGTNAATVGDAIYIPAGGPLNGGAAQTNANQAFTYP